jgi:SAM-dependent methyltransferase
MENFNPGYSRYYDLLYQDKDYETETQYLLQLMRSFRGGAKELLELGCGTGNHAAVLCREGYRVTGLERSGDMVTRANNKGIEGFRAEQGDITNFTVNATFDVALSLFHVVSYLESNTDLLSCFNAVNRHLNAGGIFIFDVWYSPAVYHLQPRTRVKRIEDELIKVTRVAEPEIHVNEQVVDVNYEILIQNKLTGITESHKEKHPMRHFNMAEIDLLARLTGFDMLRAEEFATGKPPGKDTWSVCFILQKK